jgi:hypothetical protein
MSAVREMFNPYEIKQISQPHQINSLQLKYLARAANALANSVENEWNNFPIEARRVIESIVYQSIDKRRDIRGTVLPFRVRLSLAWILIKGETDAVNDYLNALQRLKIAVLDAVEREHPEYEKKMTEALQEVLTKSDNSCVIKAEDFRDWLTNISD